MKSRTSLVDQTVTKIENKIIKGTYKPGDKLPNEIDLAEELSVSRPTIREAIKRLATRNVVTVKRGLGTYISDRPGRVDNPLGVEYLNEDANTIALDLLAVRMRLEPWMAAEAATHGSKNDILKIQKYCDQTERLINQNVSHLSEDIKFHTAIAEATGNSIMPALVPIICQSIAETGSATNNRLLKETIITHRKIMNAIKNHDRVGAYEEMTKHIELNQNYIRSLQHKKNTTKK